MASREHFNPADSIEAVRAAAQRAAVKAFQSATGASPKGNETNDDRRVHAPVGPAVAAMQKPSEGRSDRSRGFGAREPEKPSGEHDSGPDLIAESLVRSAPEGSELVVPPHSTITPLARELAFTKGVTFTTGRSAEPLGRPGARSFRIAIASDHGGFVLKSELVPLVRELGSRPFDLGPHAGDVSVDYPDFAERVAVEVSEGRVNFGIIVDGAGIGSAIAAGKVPGVRAANCWDVRTARNAREHNHANVLTLGAGHLDLAAARSIVAAFLETRVGEGRHARRALKVDAIEAEYSRSRTLARAYDEGR